MKIQNFFCILGLFLVVQLLELGAGTSQRNGNTLVTRLKKHDRYLVRKSKICEPISWQQYQSGSYDCTYPKVQLTQVDFQTGTLLVEKAAYIELQENITFNPYSKDEVQNDQALGAFSQGFFSAICLAGTNVVLDLNGYTFQQSEEHALKQRFFAIVDMASSPFMPPQGPGFFGTKIHSCKGCVVKNGHLGLSAHHGIHGNNNTGVLISNLTLKDYEVAAIHLNGATQSVIQYVFAQGTRTDVPVSALFSQAVFSANFVKNQLLGQVEEEDNYLKLEAALAAVEDDIEQVTSEVLDTNRVRSANLQHYAMPFSQVQTRVVDAIAYGIAFNTQGVAIGALQDTFNKTGETGENAIVDTTIENTWANVVHTPGVKINGALQLGLQNEVWRPLEWVDSDKKYKGNAVSDLMLVLAELSNPETGTSPSLQKLRESGAMRKFNITDEIVQFARGELEYDDIVSDNLQCNIDIMVHVLKGTLGLMVQGGDKVLIKDVDVRNTINFGKETYTEECKEDDPVFESYLGGTATGILINVSKNVVLEGVVVDDVFAADGVALGVNIRKSQNVCQKGVTSQNIDGADVFKTVAGSRGQCARMG